MALSRVRGLVRPFPPFSRRLATPAAPASSQRPPAPSGSAPSSPQRASNAPAKAAPAAAPAPQSPSEARASTPAAATVAALARPIRRTGVLAVKRGMTQLWDSWGVRMPVTVLQLDDVQVTGLKQLAQHGYWAVQLGALTAKPKNVNQPQRVVFEANGIPPKKILNEFRVSGKDALVPVGTALNAAHFVPGQLVDVCGNTIGKGFQGGMKRWGFHGLRASHGVSVSHRSLGATGQRQDPGKVFKNKKMAGHMGDHRKTIQNCQVVKIDTVLNLVYVKGAVPGHEGSVLRVTDAVKHAAPKDAPVPTYVPTVHGPLPREVLAPPSAKDPFTELEER